MRVSVKVPEVRSCCGCVPLRAGVVVSGCVNILLALLAAACLLATPGAAADGELVVTVLYALLGMALILNVLLIVAGIQTDLQMLRLYSYYAVATTLAAAACAALLLARTRYHELALAAAAIALQCYVIVVVRSAVVRLERPAPAAAEEAVDVPDVEALI